MRICGRKLNFGNLDCKEQLSKFNLFYLRGNEISDWKILPTEMFHTRSEYCCFFVFWFSNYPIYIYIYIFTIKVICLGEIQYCFQFQRKCQKHFWLLPFEQNLVQSLKQILKKKIIWRKSSAFVPTLSKLWVTAYQWVNISSKSTIKTPEQRLQILLRYLYCWLWTSVCSPGKHLNYLQNKTPRCFILMLVEGFVSYQNRII